MRNRSWQNYVFALAVVVALAIVANAELRALLLVADALGLELVALLVVVQIRVLLSSFAAASATLAETLLEAVTKRALGAIPSFIAYRPLALCPIFCLFSYGNYLVCGKRISSMDVRNG
jgi:hypothetical protein